MAYNNYYYAVADLAALLRMRAGLPYEATPSLAIDQSLSQACGRGGNFWRVKGKGGLRCEDQELTLAQIVPMDQYSRLSKPGRR